MDSWAFPRLHCTWLFSWSFWYWISSPFVNRSKLWSNCYFILTNKLEKLVNVAMLDAIFLLLSILQSSLDCSASVICLPHYLLFLSSVWTLWTGFSFSPVLLTVSEQFMNALFRYWNLSPMWKRCHVCFMAVGKTGSILCCHCWCFVK